MFGSVGETVFVRAALFALGSLALFACGLDGSDSSFNGTELNIGESAPRFELTNQFGSSVALDDFAGSVVVLTFLYTNCPSVCPIQTTQLRDAHHALGEDADGVEFVAVSVDPERDTVAAAHDYLERWSLENDWQYLVGERSRLEPLWEDYFIDSTIDDVETAKVVRESGADIGTRGALDALSAQISERYEISHSAPVFLIDADGWRRVVFTSPLDPDEIAEDIRRLLN